MPASKKKIIKSLDSLSEELQALIKKQYPNGYEASLNRITTPKKETIFVFPLETDEATYLVKAPATKNSEGDYDVDFRKVKGQFDPSGRSADDLEANEDDADQDQDDGDGYDDDDDSGGGRGRKDPSYEPDFDN